MRTVNIHGAVIISLVSVMYELSPLYFIGFLLRWIRLAVQSLYTAVGLVYFDRVI